MRIRIGNDLRVLIKMYSDDKQMNFQSVSAFLYNTTQEQIRRERDEKATRFIGRFPNEPFSHLYEPTKYNINSVGCCCHVKPFIKKYAGFGVNPDWKDIYGCPEMPAGRRVEVFFTKDKNVIELRFPSEWQLGEGDYSITVVCKVYDPGFNDNNLRTIIYDYRDVFTLVDKSYGADEFDGTINVNFDDAEEDPGNDDPTPVIPSENPILENYKAFKYENKWYVVNGDDLIYVEVKDGDTGEYIYTGWPLVAESNREGYVTIYTDGEGHMDVGRTTTNNSSVYEEFAGQFGYGTDTVNYDNDSLPAMDIRVIETPKVNPTITLFGFIQGFIGEQQYENVKTYVNIENLPDKSEREIEHGMIFSIPTLSEYPEDIYIDIQGDSTPNYPIHIRFFNNWSVANEATHYTYGEHLSVETLPYKLSAQQIYDMQQRNITGFDIYYVENETGSFLQNPTTVKMYYYTQQEVPRQVVKVFAAEFSDGSCRPVKLNEYYWYKYGLSADKYNTDDYMDINVGGDSGEQFITAKAVSGGFVSISYNQLINLKNNTDLNFDDYIGVQDYNDVIYYNKLTQEAKNKVDIGNRKIILASILTPKQPTA